MSVQDDRNDTGIEGLWAKDKASLFESLGQLSERSVHTTDTISMEVERSPVVTERPIKTNKASEPGEKGATSLEQLAVKKGTQVFAQAAPQIYQSLCASAGSDDDSGLANRLTALVSQCSDAAKRKAVLQLKARIEKTFDYPAEVAGVLATLMIKKADGSRALSICECWEQEYLRSNSAMHESTSFTQNNSGGVNFSNQITGGQVNQGKNITINNDNSVTSSQVGADAVAEETTTILFLAANPQQASQLRLDKELREVDESLRRSQKRSQFKLENKGAVRAQDFYRAILDTEPQIIHFSGHGVGDEGLALEDEQGNIAFLGTAQIERLFKLFATTGVECVVLNACYSEVQAKVIQKHIPYVVGMNQSITDEAAIRFATTFYDAIGAGKDVDFAFELGCIQLMDLGKDGIPQLLKRSA